MENLIEKFKKEADELFENYKKQAVENVNLGHSKKKVKQKDATLFIQLFSVFSNKVGKLADSYENEGWSSEEKFELSTLTKGYILDFRFLFKFNV